MFQSLRNLEEIPGRMMRDRKNLKKVLGRRNKFSEESWLEKFEEKSWTNDPRFEKLEINSEKMKILKVV